MKTARKLTSLLLALLLVFALAATAAADDAGTTTNPGSITVDNPIENQTYTAYKIFDVVYDDPTATGHYSYTIDSSNEWFTTVQSYTGLKLTRVNDTDTYVVTKNSTFSAPSFAETLKANVKDKTDGKALIRNGGSASVDNLPLGYYFVISNTDALCNLTTTAPNATIHDKNDVPFKKEGVEKKDVEVGQVLPYKITGKVPDSTGYETYTYEITDTMSQGLTFNRNSLKVTVGTDNVTSVTDKCTITYDETNAPNTFKVTIKVKNCTVGQPIEVTYTATVNENAVATVSTNEAVLKYSNKPGTTDTGTLKSDHKVYSAKITINKFWKDGEANKPLENVGFKLYKKVTSEGQETINYYKYDETTQKVSWVNTLDEGSEVKTDAQGKAYFKGLANDTYYLVETTTPAGFNPLEKPVDVKVEGNETDTKTLTLTKDIENKTGAVLPSTGGMGTTVFYVLGAVLVLGAGVLLVTKKRMSDANR